jgi:DNA-binding SARP family transcriptional activator
MKHANDRDENHHDRDEEACSIIFVLIKRQETCMPTLTLTFLGHFRVWLDGRPVVAFETDKVRALLAYLAVEADHNHSRSELASLLWPGYTEGSARTTLRHVLHQLRQTIQDATASPPFLLITRQTIQFNTMASYTLDTELFSRLLHQVSTHPHQQLARCPECLQALQQAVDHSR